MIEGLFPTFLFLIGGLFLLVVNATSGKGIRGVVASWLGGLAMVALAVFGAFALSQGMSQAFWVPSFVLVGIYGCFFLLATQTTARIVRSTVAHMARPRFRFLAVVLACGASGAVSMALLLKADEPDGNEVLSSLSAGETVSLEDVPAVAAFTDEGSRIDLKTEVGIHAGKLDAATLRKQVEILTRHGLRDHVIHIHAGWQNTNCHGWVFTGGRFWVPGAQVDKILEENHYFPVNSPRPGDVAVYRDVVNKVSHTAIVRYISRESSLVLVESKWGALGRFIHPHDLHCYGPNGCVFYRSLRSGGHRLRGIPFEGSPSTDSPSEYLPGTRPASSSIPS